MGYWPRALNFLEGLSYAHHPVLLQLPQETHKLVDGELVEWNGLRVPLHLDCNRNWSSQWTRWGCTNYFFAVPTRWTNCQLHEAHVAAKLRAWQPQLPLIDEEYSEHVAVYQAVLRAHARATAAAGSAAGGGAFVMAELGARWGTWGARAAAFLRRLEPKMPYVLHFVESEPMYCEALRQVMQLNSLHFDLDCQMASSKNLANWVSKQHHVDVLDLDIQGAELELLKDLPLLSAIGDKVFRMIIGTHSPDIQEELRALFKDWLVIYDLPYAKDRDCLRKHFRGAHLGFAVERSYRKVVDLECYNWSPWGRMANWDGELILDNPKFVRRNHFTMTDTQLVLDLL
ncbi:unnamed protein product [Effrenium voratum]|nr:unnamed protein product [Effrenium voratum]CAJ1428794.1 unnamed protein product [Effrenium voratum]